MDHTSILGKRKNDDDDPKQLGLKSVLSPDTAASTETTVSTETSSTTDTAAAAASTGSGERKLWQGNLLDGTKVDPSDWTKKSIPFITGLEVEGHADEQIARFVASWPDSLTVFSRLRSDFEDYKELLYLGKAHFLKFKSKNSHVFLQDLRSRRDCAIIELPPRILLLYISAAEQVNGLLIPCGPVTIVKWSRKLTLIEGLEKEQFLKVFNYSFPKLPQLDGTYKELMQPGILYSAVDYMPSLQSLAEHERVWKGTLWGGPWGQNSKSIVISVLEGYVSAASQNVLSLAADWPDEVHVEGFAHLQKLKMLKGVKLYNIIFKIRGGRAFFGYLMRNVYSVVIKLPSHALFLYVKANDSYQVKGLLVPEDQAPLAKMLSKFSDLPQQGNQQLQQFPFSEAQHPSGIFSDKVSGTIIDRPGTYELPLSGIQPSQLSSKTVPKYAPIWKGGLFGGPYGQTTALISILEGYAAPAIKYLAADWPDEMPVATLMKQLDGKELDNVEVQCLVFRTKGGDAFFRHLLLTKQWAVIKLPSQTLFLSVAGEDFPLHGFLLPADAAVWMYELGSRHE